MHVWMILLKNDFLGFPRVKSLQYTGEVGKCKSDVKFGQDLTHKNHKNRLSCDRVIWKIKRWTFLGDRVCISLLHVTGEYNKKVCLALVELDNDSMVYLCKMRIVDVPSEKAMTRFLSITLPESSRKRSGRNCFGCCHSAGSMCALYRFTITYTVNYTCILSVSIISLLTIE